MDDPGKRTDDRRDTTPSGGSCHRRSVCQDATKLAASSLRNPGDCQLSRTEGERDQLRIILQMVLVVSVYDGAGRSVTVQNMLRGYLATRVRMALGTRRGE